MERRSKGTHGARISGLGCTCGLREDRLGDSPSLCPGGEPVLSPHALRGPAQGWGARGASRKALLQGGGPGEHVCPTESRGLWAPDAPSQGAQRNLRTFSLCFVVGRCPGLPQMQPASGLAPRRHHRGPLYRAWWLNREQTLCVGASVCARGAPGPRTWICSELISTGALFYIKFPNGLHPLVRNHCLAEDLNWPPVRCPLVFRLHAWLTWLFYPPVLSASRAVPTL